MKKISILVSITALAYTFYVCDRLNIDLENAKDLLQKNDSLSITIVEILRQSPAQVFAIAKIDAVNASMLVKIPTSEVTLFDKMLVRGQVTFDLDPKLESFYKVKRIVASLEVTTILFTESHSSIFSYFYNIRLTISKVLTTMLNYRSAALLAGIMWGHTDLLPKVVKDHFKEVGLSHVMAVSGANMALLGQVVLSILYFLPIRWRYLMTIIFIVLFSGIVGVSAAVIRAALMAIIGAFASLSGQRYWSSRAFIFVLVVVFIFNPLIILYDVGFQLSCAATASLLFLNPKLLLLFDFVPFRSLRNLIATTTTVSLGTLPIILYYFSVWHPLSLLVNIFLLPLISMLSMVLYFLFILLFLPFIQSIIGVLISSVLSTLLELIQSLASVSSSLVLTWKLSAPILFLSYFLLIFLIAENGWCGIISRVKSLIGKP